RHDGSFQRADPDGMPGLAERRRSRLAAMIALILSLIAAPLPRAHAHNDYEHPRPLFDALEHGFCSVEADIWLSTKGDELFVAHTPFGIKPDRTLRKLYLDPLRERIKSIGAVHKNAPHVFLLIDIKTDSKTTTTKLLAVLADYVDVLRAVTVV